MRNENYATPEEFLDAALRHVESASIRAWARSEKNRVHWLGVAREFRGDEQTLAGWIVATAIGL